jgi:hypothetical protein
VHLTDPQHASRCDPNDPGIHMLDYRTACGCGSRASTPEPYAWGDLARAHARAAGH